MKDDFQIDDFVDEISRSINSAETEDYEHLWDTLPRIENMQREEDMQERGKKRHVFGKIIVAAIVILVLAAALFVLLGKQPVRETEGLWDRERGHSTILVCGTDKAGYRTDTIMLVSLNSDDREISLLSIPRDTYCDGYKTPKINATVGVYGGGAEGMEALMKRVSEKTGFMPDGYVLVSLDAFIEIVDLMGGVDFNVPMDMKYDDPAQELYIDLREGEQHLSGEQAMGLVRFRKGYKMADLTRVTVQRDFVKAAMKQWISVKNVPKLKKLMSIVKENVVTDLSNRNIMWVMKALLLGQKSEMRMDTLPGTPKTISGGSYYVTDDAAVSELMEEYSPYD